MKQDPEQNHSLAKQIQKQVSNIEKLPLLPNIAMKIMGYIDNEETPITEIADIISKDPSLAAQILKVANSAFYGLSQNVGNLERAIVILGLREIKNIIFMMSVIRLFPQDLSPVFSKAKFLKHSIYTAHTAETLAKALKQNFKSSPFLAGLLHDIGKIFLEQNFHQAYSSIYQKTQQEKQPYQILEKRILGIDHAEIGGIIAASWNFPPDLVEAIKQHHHNNSSQQKFSSIIYQANMLVNSRQDKDSPTPTLNFSGSGLEAAGLNVKDVIEQIDYQLEKSNYLLELFAQQENL